MDKYGVTDQELYRGFMNPRIRRSDRIKNLGNPPSSQSSNNNGNQGSHRIRHDDEESDEETMNEEEDNNAEDNGVGDNSDDNGADNVDGNSDGGVRYRASRSSERGDDYGENLMSDVSDGLGSGPENNAEDDGTDDSDYIGDLQRARSRRKRSRPKSRPNSRSSVPSFSHSRSSSGSRDLDDGRLSKRRRMSSESNIYDRKKKQLGIIKLNKMRERGVELSRKFTMDDSVDEIWFEIEQQQITGDTVSGVNFMREALRWMMLSLEMGNNKFGPFLQLDNLASDVMVDSEKYDVVFEKIYKRYFRQSDTHPFVQLAILISGTILAQHWKNQSRVLENTQPMQPVRQRNKVNKKTLRPLD